MQVRVLFFGILKDLAGRNSEVLSLPEGATAADVLNHYAECLSKTPQIFSSVAVSVNQEYARPQDHLGAGDEVALLPPVSGGSGGSPPNFARACITRERINSAKIIDVIKRPEDGAVAVFEGIVRNHSRGRRTLYLDYEAYEEMALREMESLIGNAFRQFQIRDAIISHRLGRVEIGETSVLVVVASAHRSPAFDACRWLIDTLKRTVPIWKKEHFEDGAVWSDGEPFPEEVSSKAIVERSASPPVGGEHKNPVTDREIPASNSTVHK